jgi:hypothetical protein
LPAFYKSTALEKYVLMRYGYPVWTSSYLSNDLRLICLKGEKILLLTYLIVFCLMRSTYKNLFWSIVFFVTGLTIYSTQSTIAKEY